MTNFDELFEAKLLIHIILEQSKHKKEISNEYIKNFLLKYAKSCQPPDKHSSEKTIQ